MAVGSLALAFVLFVLYGWRYGFTSLPKPEPGIALTNPYEITWAQVTTNNCWYWIRELGEKPTWEDGQGNPLEAFVTPYSTVGPAAATNRTAILTWLENRPMIDRTYQAVANCPDRRAPGPDSASDPKSEPVWLAAQQLRAYSLWLAAEAERQGAIAEAFNHLLEAWQLRQARTAYGFLRVDRESGAIWRRLALKATLPPREDVLRLMARLEQMAASQPSLEEACRSRAWVERDEVISKRVYLADLSRYAYSTPPSPGRLVADSFARALGEMLQYAHDAGRWLFAMLTDTKPGEPPSFSPLETFGTPLGRTAYVTLIGVTRTNDLARMYEAYVCGVVARLRTGDPTNAIAWAESLSERVESDWRSYVDRPLVWRAARIFGWPRRSLEAIRDRIVALESARLTLALRLYRETHGEWPPALTQLVPDIVPQLPLDPYSGQPFLYRTVPDGYLLASVGRDNKSADWLLSTNRLKKDLQPGYYLFGSAEPDQALATWEQQQGPRPMMDVRMLIRYGLLPKGVRIVTIGGTNVALVSAATPTNESATNLPAGGLIDIETMRRYGLLPPGFRLVTNNAGNSAPTNASAGTNSP